MFQWPKKVVKSVTFNPSVADESLLAVVEDCLEKLPDKTFSDICKQALWQSLCIPETVKPSPKTVATDSLEKKIDELQRQVADLEERFFPKQSHRLETIECHILQLTQQMAYVVNMLSEGSMIESASTPDIPVSYTTDEHQPPEEVDPVLQRLSQFLDDF
ncbi:plasmid segregation centromere-binding protein ParR [Anabaena sp. CS-542/02]|uniref:plasmid segregation centromere-binding protein ParR n=1 Tax=Anabaena sp. CS-542/02 TaxID=3021719 RepID=UPI00232DD7E6|nr:plasmid segregation centromere-binding protein ParR [Anabaena sp. CS-542/02]MDB9447640.1 plasmid segregation centromere-binding protein ParR [Anabaena sp. CS-542/02]